MKLFQKSKLDYCILNNKVEIMKNNVLTTSILIISLALLSACNAISLEETNQVDESNPGSESFSSHLSADPDYDTVFPQDEINEITIQISPDNWQIMLDDMTENYGEQGSGEGLRPADGPKTPPQGERPQFPGGEGGNRPAPGGGVMPGTTDDSNPIWVETNIIFEGNTWQHVGIRFKGNSSLKSTWSSGSLKMPFKLDFDQFEDEYPKTEDQRFYGFKQLSLSSNFRDESFLREKIAADLFREAGVASAQTAFYAVSLDYGAGPIYLGLYTAVEVVDDTLIETQFSDDSGNVYKPEGSGATFAAGSFTEASFDKETNQEEDDYSDILALFDILHSDLRQTDPGAWRQALEEVFDVDTFLNWLAVNTLIQNWDTYGVMNHNYYLYNNPETGQLVWIPWDNNESFKSSGGIRPALSLDLSEVDKTWPLISYLRDDPIYYQKYLTYLESFLVDQFDPEQMAETFQYFHDLISPFAQNEEVAPTPSRPQITFDQSVNELILHVRQRISEGEALLADQ